MLRIYVVHFHSHGVILTGGISFIRIHDRIYACMMHVQKYRYAPTRSIPLTLFMTEVSFQLQDLN